MDPVWSERCSPSQHLGPRRLHAVPVPLVGLGRIDAVVISHDHYDHLDMDTIRRLVDLTDAVFLVPLGVGAHLDAWGVPADRVVECDWEEGHEVGGVRVTAVEAQHFSGRGLRRDGTLWASWVLAGARRQGVLQRRHGVLRRLRPARRRARAVRRLADGRGGLRPGVARHPPRPRGGRRGDRCCCAAGCSCRSTGARSCWPRTRGPSRSSGCSSRPRPAACRSPCRASATGSTPPSPPGLDPWWELQRADDAAAHR